MAAILDFTRKRGFPQEDSARVSCDVLNSSTESNYVEKHFLTFVSNKYFGIVHSKMQIIHIFRSNLTSTLQMTSVSPLMIFNCVRKDIIYVALRCLVLK